MLARHAKVASWPKELRLVTDPDGLLDLVDALSEKWDPWMADTSWDRFQTFLSHMRQPGRPPYKGYDLGSWTNAMAWIALDRLRGEVEGVPGDARWMGQDDEKRTVYEVGHLTQDHAREVTLDFLTFLAKSRNRDARVMVDDTPTNLPAFGRLHALGKEAVDLVHVYRHPLDVLASYCAAREKGATWPATSLRTNACRIRDQMMRWTKGEEKRMDVLRLRFEDLVANPADELHQLVHALGLEWQDDLPEPLNVTTAHVNRWITDLTPADVESVLPTLGPVCDAFEYIV